jgi:hypothetical protein
MRDQDGVDRNAYTVIPFVKSKWKNPDRDDRITLI